MTVKSERDLGDVLVYLMNNRRNMKTKILKWLVDKLVGKGFKVISSSIEGNIITIKIKIL